MSRHLLIASQVAVVSLVCTSDTREAIGCGFRQRWSRVPCGIVKARKGMALGIGAHVHVRSMSQLVLEALLLMTGHHGGGALSHLCDILGLLKGGGRVISGNDSPPHTGISGARLVVVCRLISWHSFWCSVVAWVRHVISRLHQWIVLYLESRRSLCKLCGMNSLGTRVSCHLGVCVHGSLGTRHHLTHSAPLQETSPLHVCRVHVAPGPRRRVGGNSCRRGVLQVAHGNSTGER